MIRNLWGIEDVSNYLGVPVGTLYQWRSRGYGPAGRKIGKYVRYKPDDVERWFDAQAEGVI
ncbi:helix-turn-helix transcriptional regulator [Saccharopolyspora shandongensis]|uniref:helix-turn-helix transcriptional regulator n=1 Tax=Saccharopolyspora shandongensis TaxID=418495 RepID=UPI0033E835E7